jgi:hypothetical protein
VASVPSAPVAALSLGFCALAGAVLVGSIAALLLGALARL